MKNLFLFIFLMTSVSLFSQDTFSIVAVDSITGEVGSAGASCLDNIQFPGSNGAYIISRVFPGRGAIHTQAYWNATNQNNATNQFNNGSSPADLIGWLQENDVQNNPSIRQYGVADLDSATGSPRAAGFTGSNTDDYKNHIVGPNYAIQGNILLGPEILEDMETAFLNTQGSLAEKLMASLQAANVPGADIRCLDEGVSSLSAFLRVAQPDDPISDLSLDLNVPSTAFGVEPIDSLQVLFDNWLVTSTEDLKLGNKLLSIFPIPATNEVVFQKNTETPSSKLRLQVFNLNGELLLEENFSNEKVSILKEKLSGDQMYFYQLVDEKTTILQTGKFLFLD